MGGREGPQPERSKSHDSGAPLWDETHTAARQGQRVIGVSNAFAISGVAAPTPFRAALHAPVGDSFVEKWRAADIYAEAPRAESSA